MTARCDAADDAGAAAERHDRERALGAEREQRGELLVAPRMDDSVRSAVGHPRAQSHEIRITLAGGVEHAFAVVHAHALGAHDRGERRGRRAGEPRGLDLHLLELDVLARALGDADVLLQEGARVGGQRPGRGVRPPPPPAHLGRRRGAFRH